jgi:hypothetical protein
MPAMRAKATTPPTVPPAIAAVWDFFADATSDVIAEGDAVAEGTAPLVTYALISFGVFRYAGARLPCGHPCKLHGFVLQQPQNVVLSGSMQLQKLMSLPQLGSGSFP